MLAESRKGLAAGVSFPTFLYTQLRLLLAGSGSRCEDAGDRSKSRWSLRNDHRIFSAQGTSGFCFLACSRFRCCVAAIASLTRCLNLSQQQAVDKVYWLEPGPLNQLATKNVVYLCRPKRKFMEIIAGENASPSHLVQAELKIRFSFLSSHRPNQDSSVLFPIPHLRHPLYSPCHNTLHLTPPNPRYSWRRHNSLLPITLHSIRRRCSEFGDGDF